MRIFITLSEIKFYIILFISLLIANSSIAISKKPLVKIGTGSLSGIYYPTGSALCKIINTHIDKNGTKCFSVTTQGSNYNLNQLIDDKFSFSFSESHTLNDAYNIMAEFSNRNFSDLRSVFAIHQETYVVLVRENEKIESINDIKGKRVNIGQKGSGVRQAFSNILNMHHWSYSDFSKITEYDAYKQSHELCNNKIDVAIYMIGHPSGVLEEAVNLCNTKFVEIAGENVDNFVKQNKQYSKAIIPAKFYNQTHKEVQTIGVNAILATSRKVDNELVYNLTKNLFVSLEDFKKFHPAFSKLNKESMIKDASIIPLHEGALKYYREIGLE